MVGLRRMVWHGDVGSYERKKFLREPTELLMTTPESLEVMLLSRRVDAGALFGDLRMVVVDEIHALAGTDRGTHLSSVIERVAARSRNAVQRVGLSATVGNPERILKWLQGTSTRPGRVIDPPRRPARRELLVALRPEMEDIASEVGRMARGQKSLVFCQSRALAERVADTLKAGGAGVFVHHSSVSKEERQLAEAKFHEAGAACIVSTSTLELGIDIGDLDRVFQIDAPSTVSAFMQRMGRTGRRVDAGGRPANMTFVCSESQSTLQAVAIIELAKGGWVESVAPSNRCWPVFVHQLVALALEGEGVAFEAAWERLARVPDFGGITRAEAERLIAHMLRDESLVLADGRLLVGPKVDKTFGRQNFRELYAVFFSPQDYAVMTGDGHAIGTLEQAFVDMLSSGSRTAFLLSGRAWVAVAIDHALRRVTVEPARAGEEPAWGGVLPRLLGHELCQKMLAVVRGDEEYRHLEPAARAAIAEWRAELGEVVAGAEALEGDDGDVTWWTFAGGRINWTLRYALQALGNGWSVAAGNLEVRVKGEGVTQRAVREVIARLREMETWEDQALWAEVGQALPNFRMSKFQVLFPPWIERELVASYLIDVEATYRWLTGKASALAAVPAAVVHGEIRGAVEVVPGETPRVGEVYLERERTRPLHWIDDDVGLAQACEALMAESTVGLDVETTLGDRSLCLVQLAGERATYLIDARAVKDLLPLGGVLGRGEVTKLIHNAAFERSVLGRHGLELAGVVDTLVVSRQRHGRAAAGGHSLSAVCERELGKKLDKTEQVGDWTRRPLSEAQVDYAALDAEVLLRIAPRLGVEGHRAG